MGLIEETLLMLFLEEENLLDLYVKLHGNNELTILEYDKLDLSADKWNDFKKEELGRTLPETYEYYATENTIKFMKEGGNLPMFLMCHRSSNFNRKIKITVVGDD